MRYIRGMAKINKGLISMCIGLVCTILIVPVGAQTNSESELQSFLFDLTDVRFESTYLPSSFNQAWELHIKQPLDHDHPEWGSFWQRVYVSHLDPSRPTVLVTEGYNRDYNYASELAESIGANQVVVEHRYYGASVPDSLDYSYLNIKQASADLHRIKSLLADYFYGPWLASGISKGGQTTIFYRYFFPDDVVASVPYVAPVNLSLEDERIYSFLSSVGSARCRKNLEKVQKRILEDYDESLQCLKWHAKGQRLRFDYLTVEEAFEYAILEYPFSFWQWGGVCEEIPDKDSDLEIILDHFLEISGLGFFSDNGMNDYASHYFQCAREFGYYGYEVAPLAGLLRALPSDRNPSAIFTPNHMEVAYDGGELSRKVYDWVTEHGDQFIYINGALDTWSATAIPENPDRDALFFFMEGESHGTARLRNLSEDERAAVRTSLERWTQLPMTGSLAE